MINITYPRPYITLIISFFKFSGFILMVVIGALGKRDERQWTCPRPNPHFVTYNAAPFITISPLLLFFPAYLSVLHYLDLFLKIVLKGSFN